MINFLSIIGLLAILFCVFQFDVTSNMLYFYTALILAPIDLILILIGAYSARKKGGETMADVKKSKDLHIRMTEAEMFELEQAAVKLTAETGEINTKTDVIRNALIDYYNWIADMFGG